MLISIPPKYSVSQIMGYLKGKSSLMIFDRHANLKYKYGNRHFWARGYYVDTVGRNKKQIQEYIKNQLTEAETDENDHALNIYANYDMQRQQVCDELEITLYGSGIEDQSLTYHLNAAEKEVLREKMEAYCMQREHMPLNQLCQEILQEQDAPTQEMQL